MLKNITQGLRKKKEPVCELGQKPSDSFKGTRSVVQISVSINLLHGVELHFISASSDVSFDPNSS
jgi:hypothetical protein